MIESKVSQRDQDIESEKQQTTFVPVNTNLCASSSESASGQESNILKRKYSAPAQDQQSKKIQALESKLSFEILARDSGLANEPNNKTIKKTQVDLLKAKQELKTKKLNAEHQKKHREKVKQKLSQSREVSNDNNFSTSTVGRPCLEVEQPELLNTITSLAMFGSAVHDRRRTEEIRSCKTLGDLHKKLLELGFNLSKSALYLRLLPRNFLTSSGQRHVTTVPVKLCRAQADNHKMHKDGPFCTASIRYLECLASILGPSNVSFISQDDKARVPIGMTAVQKQSPLLMHLEYRVKLPDHDWVIAEKHKLIPSVYAGIVIKENGLGSPDILVQHM